MEFRLLELLCELNPVLDIVKFRRMIIGMLPETRRLVAGACIAQRQKWKNEMKKLRFNHRQVSMKALRTSCFFFLPLPLTGAAASELPSEPPIGTDGAVRTEPCLSSVDMITKVCRGNVYLNTVQWHAKLTGSSFDRGVQGV